MLDELHFARGGLRRILPGIVVKHMRKLSFVGIVAAGALVGLLSAADDDWATKIVLIAVGALFGSACGGR